MLLTEAVEILNSKQIKIEELASQFNVSKDLLADVLKENGFEFNNKTKRREFVRDGDPVSVDLNQVISERKSKRFRKNVREKSEKVQMKAKQNKELILTDDEIKFIKKLANSRKDFEKDFELNYEFSKLPARKPSKKVPYEISLETFEKFEAFSEKVGEPRRMSRNDLVEMALQKFMKDFR